MSLFDHSDFLTIPVDALQKDIQFLHVFLLDYNNSTLTQPLSFYDKATFNDPKPILTLSMTLSQA